MPVYPAFGEARSRVGLRVMGIGLWGQVVRSIAAEPDRADRRQLRSAIADPIETIFECGDRSAPRLSVSYVSPFPLRRPNRERIDRMPRKISRRTAIRKVTSSLGLAVTGHFALPLQAAKRDPKWETAIERGLKWVASDQSSLGHWTAGTYPTAMTALVRSVSRPSTCAGPSSSVAGSTSANTGVPP